MELTLIIGNKNYSSWSLRPWIFLKYFNLDFKETNVSLFTETSDKELAPYFSNFKVPVLKDGDQLIWDSLSILEYLSENFCAGSGWPEDKNARAFSRSMSAEMHSSFTALRNELPMNCRKSFSSIRLSSDATEDVKRIITLWNTAHEKYGSGEEWLMGKFSIADAMYIPVVLRFHGYGIETQGYANDYIQTVLNNRHIKEWIDAGTLETEIIEEDEI